MRFDSHKNSLLYNLDGIGCLNKLNEQHLLPLMSWWFWFVGMLPHIDQADRSMETVEHNQRQRNVIQNAPHGISIEIVPYRK